MCFFIAKHTNIVIFYFKDVSTALDMTMVTTDMTVVTLGMTMLAGADPDERHTDKDERQIHGLGPQVPFLEDEGSACE